MGIVAALFMAKMVPETKGRSLEQMEHLWGGAAKDALHAKSRRSSSRHTTAPTAPPYGPKSLMAEESGKPGSPLNGFSVHGAILLSAPQPASKMKAGADVAHQPQPSQA